jgi:hypothetical protein
LSVMDFMGDFFIWAMGLLIPIRVIGLISDFLRDLVRFLINLWPTTGWIESNQFVIRFSSERAKSALGMYVVRC